MTVAPIWKKIMKFVELGEAKSFLDHVFLACTPNKTVVDEYRKMFESRTTAAATEKLPGWEKLHAETVAWSHDMEGHAKKVR